MPVGEKQFPGQTNTSGGDTPMVSKMPVQEAYPATPSQQKASVTNTSLQPPLRVMGVHRVLQGDAPGVG